MADAAKISDCFEHANALNGALTEVVAGMRPWFMELGR